MESLKWKIDQYIPAHIQFSLGWYTILEFPLKLWKYLDTLEMKLSQKNNSIINKLSENKAISLTDMLYTEKKNLPAMLI